MPGYYLVLCILFIIGIPSFPVSLHFFYTNYSTFHSPISYLLPSLPFPQRYSVFTFHIHLHQSSSSFSLNLPLNLYSLFTCISSTIALPLHIIHLLTLITFPPTLFSLYIPYSSAPIFLFLFNKSSFEFVFPIHPY